MQQASRSERQMWMGVLARASRADIAARIDALGPLPAFVVIKAAETGTVMVEGRAGGGGRRFNAGEATMTRAIVQLDDGVMGFAYALGTDRRKAELSAVLDAMAQTPHLKEAVMTQVITPLATEQQARRDLASRKAAATKVDFFTLARGDG